MRMFGKSKGDRFLIVQGETFEKILLSDSETYLFGINAKKNLQRISLDDTDPVATVYEEAGEWVLTMLVSDISINVDDEQTSSIVLTPETPVKLLDTEIKIVEMGKASDENNQEESSPLKVVLLSAVLGAIILISFFGADKEDADTQTADVKQDVIEADDAQSEERRLLENADPAIGRHQTRSKEYRLALSYYDSGNLKLALKYLEKSLLDDPANKMAMKKLIELETDIDKSATRHYQNGCEHAGYMRNYEAKADFRAIQSLIRNHQDARYVDASRMLVKLEKKGQRVLCRTDN